MQVVHLLPAGRFSGRDGRGPYTNEDSAAIIEATRRQAGKRLLPVDYDHQIDHAPKNGNPAPAAGWITSLQQRSDGIWGVVEWTPRAIEHLKLREYRYLSPVIRHDERGKIFCLLRASLTNNPNLDQLTALASREDTMDFFEQIKDVLGLPAEADEATTLAKLKEQMTATHAVDPSQFVPIGDFERTVAELNRVNRGVSLQAATDHVASKISAGMMPPFLKEWGISLCTANKPAFDAFIERSGGEFYKRLFGPSIAMATPPDMHSTSKLTDAERQVVARMGLSDDEFSKNKRSHEL